MVSYCFFSSARRPVTAPWITSYLLRAPGGSVAGLAGSLWLTFLIRQGILGMHSRQFWWACLLFPAQPGGLHATHLSMRLFLWGRGSAFSNGTEPFGCHVWCLCRLLDLSFLMLHVYDIFLFIFSISFRSLPGRAGPCTHAILTFAGLRKATRI